MFNKASILVVYLNEKFSTVESLYSRMHQNMFLFAPSKEAEPVADKKVYYNGSNVLTDSRKLEEAIKDLENKFIALDNREKEIEVDAAENAKTAKYLNETKEKMLSAKNEIDQQREKLKMQFYQLDQRLKALATKEKELATYKKELDCIFSR